MRRLFTITMVMTLMYYSDRHTREFLSVLLQQLRIVNYTARRFAIVRTEKKRRITAQIRVDSLEASLLMVTGWL
mgnify:CR=1 FL=1